MTARLLVTVLLAGCLLPVPAAPAGDGDAEPARGPGKLLRAADGDWPWWRGPGLDGTSADGGVVSRWGATENVVWRAEVPGRGHASPAVCGDRVFLASADEQAQKQLILAFDRRTGRPLWTATAHEGGFLKLNPKNSHASATPACDGERVYAAFVNRGGLHVTATDLGGTVVWQAEAGPFTSQHGYGSSPVLYGPLVIVNGDSLDGSFVAALDRRTGKLAWRTARKFTGRHGSYATPVVAELAGRPQLLLTGTGLVTAYDPDTGALLWSCAGPAEVTGCTPAFGEGLVFATGGFPEKEVLAVRADGRGDVTGSHVAWRTGRGAAYVPSPLYHGGRLYVVTDTGVVSCLEAATGRQVWQGRLPGAYTASPVLAGGVLLVTSEAGKTHVLKAGPRFEVLGANDLGDGGMATPAVAGGRLFIRTSRHLYCLGEPAGVR